MCPAALAAQQYPLATREASIALEFLYGRNKRKRKPFPEAHARKAWNRLRELNWLSEESVCSRILKSSSRVTRPSYPSTLPGSQMPWKPNGTRAGSSTRAIGLAVKSRASTTSISLLFVASSKT